MSYILNMPQPLVTRKQCKEHLRRFLKSNATVGVRNADAGRALGCNDKRQWFSYGLLEAMIQEGTVRKEKVGDATRYFPV